MPLASSARVKASRRGGTSMQATSERKRSSSRVDALDAHARPERRGTALLERGDCRHKHLEAGDLTPADQPCEAASAAQTRAADRSMRPCTAP